MTDDSQPAFGEEPPDEGFAADFLDQEGPSLFGEEPAPIEAVDQGEPEDGVAAAVADEPEFDDGAGLDDDAKLRASEADDEVTDEIVLPVTPAGAAPGAATAAPPPAATAPGVSAPSDPAPRATAEPPLALYRRYRPDTFADVIGQEHVTEPLQRALVNNRVNHAYLFSGPRGCGKTTSARILARCLNCEQGPTPTPCGVCQSCRDLARGGPGSLDVIEMDAASHGGVDDARDLRERAFFAPVHSRYKIYIVDEAHQVTNAGFNALLKVVEEPPPHVKFIFATTEPEKVIGTIRSRTHHYPFRLVPPKTLGAYLGELCEREGVAVEPAVLPLVVRAGAGSVRDSLSVLDQLLGGAGQGGVSYQQATALLGYTPDALLDEMVDAFAAGDGGAVFATVDKVIEVGQDPRRFAEDLLRRLRDLVIVAAVPDALTSGLVDVPADQAERLTSQAAGLGSGELTRAAEVIALGLTEMRGTTAPRLFLELMCARVLLPGADVDGRGVHARLDRLERRLDMVGGTGADPPPAEGLRTRSADERREAQRRERAARQPDAAASPADDRPAARPADRPSEPSAGAVAPPPRQRPPAEPPVESPAPRPASERETAALAPSTPPTPAPAGTAGSGPSASDVRRLWPQVLEEVKRARRYTWILLSQNSQVVDVRDGVLTLGMANAGARDSFGRGGSEDVLREALVAVMGADLRIAAVVDDGGSAGSRPTRSVTAETASEARRPDDEEPSSPQSAAAAPEVEQPAPPVSPETRAAVRENIRPTRQGPAPAEQGENIESVSMHDAEVVDSADSAGELLTHHLGAQIIGEEES